MCGQRGQATVNAEDTFEGFEELYLIGDAGFGVDVCVVRFDVTRVGPAPGGCNDFAGQQDECLWTHEVAYSNPQVLVDEDGACESESLGADAAGIAALDGSTVSYGFVSEVAIWHKDTATWQTVQGESLGAALQPSNPANDLRFSGERKLGRLRA